MLGSPRRDAGSRGGATPVPSMVVENGVQMRLLARRACQPALGAALVMLGAGVAFAGPPPEPVEIRYQATDLDDEAQGEDLWEYSYHLGSFPYPAGYGFSVFFDYATSDALVVAGPANADWDALALQPDLELPADGLYDAMALIAPASVEGEFRVRFVWLGEGPPGAQPFEIYDGKDFRVVEEGLTHLPEPGAAHAGLTSGLCLTWLASLRRRGPELA